MASYELGETVFTREQIEERAAEIGKRITEDYAGKEVFLLGILTGCVMWMADVMKAIDLDTAVDFMAISSYGAATRSSGIVRIVKDLGGDIKGRHVIIIEDVIDTGTTLDYLCKFLEGREPASLSVCTMLDKPAGRQTYVKMDYIGFTAPDAFLVGYGLDANQKYRNLPFIAMLGNE